MALSGNASVIASFFSGKGLSAAGVAGVLGTWQAESGLNPSITNSIGAHGLAQWLGARRTQLQQLASRLGVTENDINAQLQFAWQELQQPQYASLLHELQTTTDPQAAARDFVNVFERPGPGGDPGAPGFAQTFFSGGVPGGAGSPGLGVGGGGSTQNAGDSGPSPWWSGFLGGFGTVVGGNPDYIKNAKTGTEGIIGGIAAFVQDFAKLLSLLSDLFKASFWLRVVSFLVGIVCLIGGFLMLKGAAL